MKFIQSVAFSIVFAFAAACSGENAGGSLESNFQPSSTNRGDTEVEEQIDPLEYFYSQERVDLAISRALDRAEKFWFSVDRDYSCEAPDEQKCWVLIKDSENVAKLNSYGSDLARMRYFQVLVDSGHIEVIGNSTFTGAVFYANEATIANMLEELSDGQSEFGIPVLKISEFKSDMVAYRKKCGRNYAGNFALGIIYTAEPAGDWSRDYLSEMSLQNPQTGTVCFNAFDGMMMITDLQLDFNQ